MGQLMKRKNVQAMQGERDRHKQRILNAPFARVGFTISCAAGYLKITASAAGLYCKQLSEDSKLRREVVGNRVYYRLNALCLDDYWRVQNNGIELGRFYP